MRILVEFDQISGAEHQVDQLPVFLVGPSAPVDLVGLGHAGNRVNPRL
ncbi:MAG: hypothetical protein DHS20C11_12440 [Lysobacteraceae bacterium]|nr:MAG: hypothetical protein DHS20C11_12440 [Xanthomonadaceae bacterium]